MNSARRNLDLSNKRNSLGVESQVYMKLLEKLNTPSRPSSDKRKPIGRKHTRLEYVDPFLELSLQTSDHSTRTITVATRNISRGGMSVLHSSFVYPGTYVSASLTRVSGPAHPISGRVVRCEHRGGVVHEIGIKFGHEITVQEFVRPDINEAIRSYEVVRPELLTGKLLVVGTDKSIVPFAREYLQTTCIQYGFVDSGAEALKKDLRAFSLIFACMDVGKMTGPEFAKQLREHGYHKPVLLSGQASDELTRSQIRLSTADMYVPSPLCENDLMCALGEYLLNDWSEETLHAVRAGINRENTCKLRSELSDLGVQLEKQLETQDPVQVYATCTKIRSIAPLLGMKSLRDLSLRVGDEIASDGDLDAHHEALLDIRRICDEVGKAA